MQKTKVFLRTFLAILLMTTASASWAEEFTEGYLTFTYTPGEDVCSVTKCESSASGKIEIPTSITVDGSKYSVTSIGDIAFWVCDALTSITLPSTVTSIGHRAFSGIKSLTEILVDENNASFSSAGGVLYDKQKTTLIQAPGALSSITIPNTVTCIGEWAFQSCTSLSSITIPNSVIRFDERAFFGCSSLASITIPNSVISIGDNAFERCTSLSSITIPSTVTSIGVRAFILCSSMTEILVDENNVSFSSEGGVLYNKQKTALIHAPSALTSITIPSTVTSIECAFCNCSSLTSITIPASVTSIGMFAFYECTSLTDIYCLNSVPCTLESFVFDYTARQTLHVPSGTKAAYQEADGWKEFKNIVEEAPANVTYKVTYMVDGEVYKVVEVAYGEAIPVEEAPTKEGYIFSGWSEIPETMPAEDIVVTGTFVLDNSADVYERLAFQINELHRFFDELKYGIIPECEDVAAQFVEQMYRIQEDIYELEAMLEWLYDAGELTADSEREIDMRIEDVYMAIIKLREDVRAAQEAYEAEQAKIAANETAYTKLMQEITELQTELNAAKETINTECADVAAQFAEQITSIQNSIDALSADVKAKYDAVELTADSNIDTGSVTAAVEKLIADAKTAQQAYEAEQAKIAANEAAYTKLMQEIAELQAKLDAAKETINTECKDVAEQFAEQLASLQDAINALQSEIDAKYANCELTAESTINVADVIESIETTTEAATEAQKKHEEAVGIHGIDGNGTKVKAIYNINGKKVSSTKPNQMYIIEYSDGRKVKTIVKK